MNDTAGAPPVSGQDSTPLTERVLRRLPGPRVAWVILWSVWFGLTVLPLFAYGLYPQIQEGADLTAGPATVFSILFIYANLVSIWGIRRIESAVASLRPALASLDPEGRSTFAGIGKTSGPVLISSVFVLAFMYQEIFVTPSGVDVIAGVGFLVGLLPLTTLLWIYGAVLWGLNRLGAKQLRLAPFEEDRSLGLRPLGRLALLSFGFVAAVQLPLTLADMNEPRDVIFSVVLYGVILGLLFLSVLRLRGQLIRARDVYVRRARRLYAEAFRAATADGDPAAMREHAPELQVATEAERRAAGIQTWPFDEPAFRAIGAVITSVVTAIIVRLVLSRVGL